MKNYTRSSISVNSLFAIAFLFLLFSFNSLKLRAQTEPPPLINSTLQGTIRDAKTKEALVGVTVQLKGTTHVARTDDKGRFNFVTGQKFPYILIITYTGYTKTEITATGSPIEIPLHEDVKALNEIVVVGYGTQVRKNLIGSVSKINPAETKNIPEASFDAQLQGKASGVQISSNTGVPGSDVFIRVRGTTSINASNDPLYVIDGVFVNNSSLQNIAQDRGTSSLADINPADIESIEILKDASAVAIYGSRGANGVVIVTTRRGN
ncbi:TonB-dependent receptor plug domain-containing protein [Pedobacter sp.]|uniref:TonB-dependent receptor plug domain-containing protein n=1 Tax=Pedobacter sp. TaxID=1411316 RepID=UPI003D7FF69A